MIFEHDSRIIKKLPADSTFQKSKFDIICINDPSMATRKSKLYQLKLLKKLKVESTTTYHYHLILVIIRKFIVVI